MKTSLKAALYSALVFPGVGYFIVKQKGKAWLFLTTTLVSMGVVIVDTVHKAQTIASRLISGDLPMDISTIRDQLSEVPGTFNPTLISVLTFFILIIWLFGIIDCYRIGKSIDNSLNH